MTMIEVAVSSKSVFRGVKPSKTGTNVWLLYLLEFEAVGFLANTGTLQKASFLCNQWLHWKEHGFLYVSYFFHAVKQSIRGKV